MSLSKLTLLAVASAFVAGSVAAHADSLNLGSPGEFLTYSFDNHTETGAGGNFSPSSAVIGGKTVVFDAVYCVDLSDFITPNKTYNDTTFTTNGVVNGQFVHNRNQIAWLLLNIVATTADQQAGLQAAIWEEEYGHDFTLITGGNVAADQQADLWALDHAGNYSSSLYTQVDWISPGTSSEDCNTLQGLVGVDPVPEPGTLSLLGTGILGIAGMIRRRMTA
jgi:hypothetical protein